MGTKQWKILLEKLKQLHAAHLDLNEVWFPQGYQVSISFHFIHIPSFHQGQPVNSALLLE